jgi:ferredoxin-NADP reductase
VHANTPEHEDELVVERRTTVADGVVALTLVRPDGGPLPRWKPGAHIDLCLAPGLTRQVSLCGDPADAHSWRVAVLRRAGGDRGATHVHERLTTGARVRIRGPRNHFPLQPAARHLFVAGGIGITAILPMVHAADAAGAWWRLLYGGRSRSSMAFLDELASLDERASPDALAGHGPGRVRIVPEDEEGLPDLAGFLSEPRDDTLVHCCGPEPLLAAVEEQCRAWPPGTLRTERFRPRPDVTPDTGAPFEVVLRRSARTLTVPPGVSIGDAVRAAGVEVPFPCEEGTCGACATTVLDGVPLHRDSVLTDQEKAAGDTVLICVSRSRSARLVLDL